MYINFSLQPSDPHPKRMNFYSTRNREHIVDIKTAVLRSLPPDNGLYMPVNIPQLPSAFWDNLADLSFSELAFQIAQNLLTDSLPTAALESIVTESINFPAPLVQVAPGIYTLELWHGPSLAFKDFGARFMAKLMSYLVRDDDNKLSILVATSGDTGGAVAAGFHGVDNIEVTILFPKGKVSPLQQLQLTTWGDNIRAIEIDGTFDDCQALVKQAFLDSDINEKRNLSSANSINIARLIPQSFYYFEAYKQLASTKQPLVFSVPSGNFGNLTAGLLAKRMGLPIHTFLAATNANNIVPGYLEKGAFEPRPSVQTISNAMDVGNPSNFQRMVDLYGNNDDSWSQMKTDIQGYAYDDVQNTQGIRTIFAQHGYTADPHGAIGYLALQDYLKAHPGHQGIFLETAHPAKFLPVMEPVLGEIDVPEALSVLEGKPQDFTPMANDYAAFKGYLWEG